MDLAWVQGQLMTVTVPEEYELNQFRWEFKKVVSLDPNMHLRNCILRAKMQNQHRKLWLMVCPQPLSSMIVWETQHISGALGPQIGPNGLLLTGDEC